MPSGGKRAGSGRKTMEQGVKRVQLMITISPRTRDSLKAQAQERGVSVGQLVDSLVETGKR